MFPQSCVDEDLCCLERPGSVHFVLWVRFLFLGDSAGSDSPFWLLCVVLQPGETQTRSFLNSPISPAAVLIPVFRNGPLGLVPCICKYERLLFLLCDCFLHVRPLLVSLCTTPSATTPTRAISLSASQSMPIFQHPLVTSYQADR